MNKFDLNQQRLLDVLAGRRVVLHFPFFANTFSLPFHYANALNANAVSMDASDQSWENTKPFICEHDWQDPIPNLVKDRTNVFYATAASVELFSESNTAQKWDLVAVSFTRFKPLWIFTDYRAFLLNQVDRSRNTPLDLSRQIVKCFLSERIEDIELLTDIPGQLPVIIEHLRKWGFDKRIYVLKDPVDALRSIDASKKVTRLYFYGAPSTTKMLEQPIRFIPLKIPESMGWSDKTMTTQICLAAPKETWTDAEKADFAVRVREYHDRVFTAAEDDHTDLINVWWAYNRYAERKQHNAMFESPESFARCLRDHHARV